MDYLTLKTIHVGSVIASYALFFVRGVWMIRSSPKLGERWVRIVPHAVDTVLLASALMMAVMIRQYPFEANWLTAKVIGLAIYIALGMTALRFGKARSTRMIAWVAAQIVFLYIVSVAVTRDPLGFL